MFAKPPVAGRVKTRLAAAIGAEAAAELAAAMLADTWATVVSTAGSQPVLATAEEGDFPETVLAGVHWQQGEGDLGTRLESVLRRGIELSGRAIAIGADSPLLEVRHLARAITDLQTHDAVIGPAFDGGYYLLGLRRCPPGLLAGLPWSTPQTRESTIERLYGLGLSVVLLDPLPDIDVAADLSALSVELERSPVPAHHTRAWLARYASVLKGMAIG